MKSLQRYFNLSLFFWFLVATYGYILRWHMWKPLPINFSYWLHAHSHGAFLGWLHAAFTVLLAAALIPQLGESKKFGRLFIFSQLMVAAMMISFPVQGYKAFSITFLSFFLLGTYVLAYWFLRKTETREHYPATFTLARSGVVFMILSSLSPWALGPVMVFLGKKSIWYNLDIYFYLHFQYNGWFFLSMLALLVYLFEKNGSRFDPKRVARVNALLFAGVLLGYVTNTLWTQPPLYMNVLALISVFLEAAGLRTLYRMIRREPVPWQGNRFFRRVFLLILMAVAVKVVLQFMASCPYFARITYQTRDLIIGYLHWVMLVLYSVAILFIAAQMNFYRLSRKMFWFFYSGLMLMEGFIFLRGVDFWLKWNLQWPYALLIFLATTWMYLGITGLSFRWKKEDMSN